MPNLGDYLGQLLSEISLARLHADLETIRLAELYAQHPLLRALPVPRVRVPEIELDVPVLIQDSPEAAANVPFRGGASTEDLRKKFDELLPEELDKAGVRLSDADRTRLAAVLDERVRTSDVPNEISGDVRRVAKDLTTATREFLEEHLRSPSRRATAGDEGEEQEPSPPESFARALEEGARREFLKLRTPPPRLTVQVTSGELRENPDNVIRMHLKVTEEGVEWTSIETEGARQERLTAE